MGSGLDTDSIIQQLTDIERRPIRLIERRQAQLQQQKGVVQQINSELLSLKDSAAKLADDDLFSIVKVASQDSQKVSATATNEAAAGTFKVEVLGLAQARSLSTRSFSTTTEALTLSGEFVVNGKAIEVGTGDSLLDIRDAVNAADIGVSAQILTVSAGDNRLILTAEDVGSKGFDIKDASAASTLEGLGLTSSDTSVKTSFINGARTAKFLDDTTAVGTLLNLNSPPTGTITVGDQQVAIDLATDSLGDIRDKITAAAPSGVTASVTSTDEGGLTRFQLEIEGTTNIVDNSGVVQTLGVLDTGGAIVDEIVAGAQSDQFTSTTTAVGSLMGLAAGPSGTVQIAGQSVNLNLAADSLTDIQTRINDAGITGVSATITTSTDADGTNRFRLRIEGTSDLTDDGNVLEGLGLLQGSNNAFESVAQALTATGVNQQIGAILNPTGNGAKSAQANSDVDPVGPILGSSASGTVTVGDAQVTIDLNSDSLADIRDKINTAAPTGVTAVVNVVGPSDFELEIQGTTQFADSGGVLQGLGVLGAPGVLTASTQFDEIAGAAVQAGDTISISGVNHSGDQVAGTFTVGTGTEQVSDLLTEIEQLFGNQVTASVDVSGRVVLADGQAGDSSLSLSLTANNEGGGSLSFGSFTVTTNGSDARSSELQAGKDATFQINGIDLSRSTNTVSDAVQGVILKLNEAEVGKLVEITVTKDDTTQVRQRIEDFVQKYNSALELINQQFVFNEGSQTSGPLAADATIRNLQTQLRSLVSNPIEGLDENLNAMVLIGVTFDRQSQLTIDDARLTAALTENLDQVRALFTSAGTTTDGLVEFVGSTKDTRAGNYVVGITSAAEKASATGSTDISGGIAADQTLTITESETDKAAVVELAAGDDVSDIVAKINAKLGSEVAELRRATIANTTNGADAVSAATSFAQIFGAGAANGDTIRIQGTGHDGDTISQIFTIDDVNNKTVGDLLDSIRTAFKSEVSASVDAEGRIVVTDSQVGPSSLTVTLVEENEGGGSLNFGSIDVEDEGRFAMEITATSNNGALVLEHNSFGSRNGFGVSQSADQLGLADAEFTGTDVAGTINGETAEGLGRILSGADGNENTEGLALRVTATADDLQTSGEDRGSTELIHGVGRLLNDRLGFITDTIDGTLKNRERAIDDTIESLDSQIQTLERRVARTRQNLVRKFAALEGSLATLQSQGNFLSSQLAGITAQTQRR